MKLRAFLASIPAALFSVKSLALTKPVLVPPTREWPWHDQRQSPVGLWVQIFDYDKKVWSEPWFVSSEFDENTDNPYQGMELNNCRRNKFWGRKIGTNHRELLIINHWEEYGMRFFRDATNTDWSTVSPV